MKWKTKITMIDVRTGEVIAYDKHAQEILENWKVLKKTKIKTEIKQEYVKQKNGWSKLEQVGYKHYHWECIRKPKQHRIEFG